MIFDITQEIATLLIIILSWFISLHDTNLSYTLLTSVFAISIRLLKYLNKNHILYIFIFISCIFLYLIFPLYLTLLYLIFIVVLLLITTTRIFGRLALFFFSIAVISIYLISTQRSDFFLYIFIIIYFIVSVPVLYLIFLRQDIEFHHIIKHRLGKQSKIVTVPYMLSSKKILNSSLRMLIVLSTLLSVGLTVVLGYASISTVKRLTETFGLKKSLSFPSTFNLKQIGKVVLSNKKYVVLTTYSTKPPIYLKHKVFDEYQNGVWFSSGTTKKQNLCLKSSHKIDIKNYGLYSFGTIPPNTCRVSKSSGYLTKTGILVFNKQIKNPSYTVFTTEQSTTNLINNYLKIPQNLIEQFKKLGFSGHTFEEKFEEVKNLLKQYDYSNDYGKPKNDPILNFLFSTRQGPCGLFAASSVMLLRFQGISARLVIGFSHGKQINNKIYFYGKDAHAWVEYFHPLKGWSIFDPTLQSRLNLTSTNKTETHLNLLFALIAIISFLGTALYILFYVRKLKNKQQTETVNLIHHTKTISVSKYEATILFNEITSLQLYKENPRKVGETALNYAHRMKQINHPYAQELLDAANIANRLLFAGLSPCEKQEFLKLLKKSYQNLNHLSAKTTHQAFGKI